jgi:hypothetical protein
MHVGIPAARVQPIAFDLRACFIVEGQQQSVANDRIGGCSKNAFSVSVSPDDVAR